MATMSSFQLIMTAVAAIMLFLYSLQSFSREVRALGNERLRRWLAVTTGNRVSGFALGAVFTAVVQSSTTVSILALSLLNAGLMAFPGTLAVLLGAKVGTTLTTWLVSFKLTGIGSFAIIIGTILSALPYGVRVAGKSVFYFGLIFLSLDLVSTALGPFRDDPRLIGYLASATVPWIGVLAGTLATVVLQSSTVTAGLAVVLVQQGVLATEGAVAILLGANVGTCFTALIAGASMSQGPRRAALAYLLFSATGALLFLPFVTPFTKLVVAWGDTNAVALAHLLFNVVTAMMFLPILGLVVRVMEPKRQLDLLRDTKPESAA